MRRDFSLTFALCGSILVHATVTEILAETYIQRAGKIYLPGYAVATAAAIASDEEEPKLGDAVCTGDALDASAGELPQQAEQADHAQAFLGLDPQGSKSQAGSSADAWQQSIAPPAPPAESADAVPFGLSGDESSFSVGAAQPKAAAASAEPSESHPAEAAGPTGAASEQALTESDPVSVIASAQFRSGRTEIQYGRAHKITRPHLSLAAQADLLSIARPLLTLKITTDAAGQVQNVTIFKSSGSGNIDEGCKVAAYKWWFEPAKDHAGTKRGDVILFNIRFI